MSYRGVRCNSSTRCSVLAAVLVILSMGSTAQAQDLSGLAGLGSSLTNGVTVTPQVQVGYQKLGLNFNLPALRDPGPLAWPSTLDLELRKADLWLVALEADVDFPSGLTFGLKAQTNFRKNASAYERQEYVEGGTQGVNWTASNLQWWTIDGRLMYRFSPDFSVAAGLRRENLSFNLTNPTTDQGFPLNLDDSGNIGFGLTYERRWRYSSNLVSKLWIPYVGLDIIGNQYKASLIASPFASAEVQVPAEYFTDTAFFLSGFPLAQLITNEELKYRVMKPAVFVEGNFSYDINVSAGFKLGLWLNASWLRLRGQGNWNYSYTGQVPPLASSSFSESQQNTAVFTRYLLGGGVSAELYF